MTTAIPQRRGGSSILKFIFIQISTEYLYLGGDAYSAPAIYVKEGANDWNICVKLNDQNTNLLVILT